MLSYPFVLFCMPCLFHFLFFLFNSASFRSAWRIRSMHAEHCLGRRMLLGGGTTGRQRREISWMSVIVHSSTCYKGWMQMPHFLYSWMHGIITMEFVSETDLNLCTCSWWKLCSKCVSGTFLRRQISNQQAERGVAQLAMPPHRDDKGSTLISTHSSYVQVFSPHMCKSHSPHVLVLSSPVTVSWGLTPKKTKGKQASVRKANGFCIQTVKRILLLSTCEQTFTAAKWAFAPFWLP